jgi:hypothetical protein
LLFITYENARIAPRRYIKKLSSTPRNRDAMIMGAEVTDTFAPTVTFAPRVKKQK